MNQSMQEIYENLRRTVGPGVANSLFPLGTAQLAGYQQVQAARDAQHASLLVAGAR